LTLVEPPWTVRDDAELPHTLPPTATVYVPAGRPVNAKSPVLEVVVVERGEPEVDEPENSDTVTPLLGDAVEPWQLQSSNARPEIDTRSGMS